MQSFRVVVLRIRSLWGCVALILGLFTPNLLPLSASAATQVKLGEVRQITGPADLDLDGEVLYAVNFSTDDPVRTIRGVRFLPDTQRIVGASFIAPQQVAPWMTKPEFGSSVDANQLEEVLQDIRWANSGASERLRATFAVTNGMEYKVQILISGNGPEDRRWDIRVAGREAVDEITSLGVSPGQSYAINRATLYTCQIVATNRSLVVEMGDFFGRNDGGDRNPIWQGLIVKRVINSPKPDDIVLGNGRFFPDQSAFIDRLRVVDLKSGVSHGLSLAAGLGDTDNAKFVLVNGELRPGDFDFSGQPSGSTYSVRVSAVDTADASRFLEKAFTLTLEEPHAPLGMSLGISSMSSVARPGALFAKVQVQDPDLFDRHSFQLEPGTGDEANSLLSLQGNELRLAALPPPGLTAFRFRLKATDLAGLSATVAFDLPRLEPSVRVNELVGNNLAGVTDELGDLPDWIELQNLGGQWVDLKGWYLSDDPNDRTRWSFPAGEIPPNGFQVVLADGKGVTPLGSSSLHAGFGLDASGSRVDLVLPDGVTVLSRLNAPEFLPGISYGVGGDGRPGYLSRQTPGATNVEPSEVGENRVSFGKSHGFYTNSFLLELTAPAFDSVIRFTLDGSLPSATKGIAYTNPIPIKPNTTGGTRGVRIVRAIAFSPRAAYSPVTTQTYLFINGETGPAVDGVVGQSVLTTAITRHAVYGPLLDDALLDLPTLSLVLPTGLDTTEKAASIELFDPGSHEQGFQIDCGVQATGTTSLGSPKLSMAARFRAEYGRSKLRYPMFARGSLFPAGAAKEFRELRLRSHSHDTFYWLGTVENPPVPYGDPPVNRSGDAQLTRNLWIEETQLLMGQPGKHGRQVHLYLNGTYHGIYHIQEHADEDFMASYYPGKSEDFHFSAAALRGSEHGGGGSWQQPWTAMKASLGNYAEAKRWVDVTNLCDYMVLSFHAGNDWDWSVQHNWGAAGPALPDRGGWKFFQQDSDISLQDVAADNTDQDVPDGIFTALMRYSDFRVLFRDRVYLHCFNKGALTAEVAGALYDTRMNEITNAIVAESARWQPSSSAYSLPWDRDQEWRIEWKYLREVFFPQRVGRLIQQFRKHAGWWPLDPPVLSKRDGVVPAGFPLGISSDVGVTYYTLDGSDPRLPGGGIHPAAIRLNSVRIQTRLVATNTVWRFLDNATDPGALWNGVDFDDTAWRAGATEIGYGDGGEATVAGFIDTDPVIAGIQRNITTYFRKSFDAPNSGRFQEFKLRLVRDDGAAVYLNGVEILRTNLPAGVITNQSRALLDIASASDETTFLEFVFRPDQLPLRATNNILAVEMHQKQPASADMSFNLELIGYAIADGSSVIVQAPTLLRARTFSGTDWSALTEAYLVPDTLPKASSDTLLITEIHYAPTEQASNEFLEFLNPTTFSVDLSDVVITQAVSFRFPRQTVLGPSERVMVVRDPSLFAARYMSNGSPYFRAGLRMLGPWDGSLANEGESVAVQAQDGSRIFESKYGVATPWPVRANGRGSSLELIEPASAPLGEVRRSQWLSDPLNWRPSPAYHGSPGAPGDIEAAGVVINELLSNPLTPATDGVELLNVGVEEADLSGWFLSDTSDTYRKYRFQNGARLPVGSRMVLREADFNRLGSVGCLVPFAFSSGGESVSLVQANPDGALLRFVDGFEFGATPRGVSVGRWPDGGGPLAWLQALTLGAPNAAPVPGYAAWAATAFSPGTPIERTQPEADPDGDGFINYWEYIYALSPLLADVSPIRALGVGEDGNLVLSYRTRSAAGELGYGLEITEDLIEWTPAGARVKLLSAEAGTDGATVVRVSLQSVSPATFVRLRVTP